MPGLIWNMMMSMSGGWFFVVASEAITVGNARSCCRASARISRRRSASENLHAIGWVILTMTVVILAYDQLLFRPLVAWADKFRMETTSSRRRAGIVAARPDPPHAPDSPAARAARLAVREGARVPFGCRALQAPCASAAAERASRSARRRHRVGDRRAVATVFVVYRW